MTVLHLGVIDIPYAIGGMTTGAVAEILEDKYHVMEHFYEFHDQTVVDFVTDAIAGSFETVQMGGPVAADPYAAGYGEIEVLFQKFIDAREMDGLGYPGIPTVASLKGVSHRFKHPYAKGHPVRASFYDTGLYYNSFKVWADNG